MRYLIFACIFLFACHQPMPTPPALTPPAPITPRVGELQLSTYGCHNDSQGVWTYLLFHNRSNKTVTRTAGRVVFKSNKATLVTAFNVTRDVVPDAQNFSGPRLHRITGQPPKNWGTLANCDEIHLELVEYKE